MADTSTTPQTAPAPAKIKKRMKISVPAAPAHRFSTAPFWVGLLGSVSWVALVAYAVKSGGAVQEFGGIPLTNWAIGLSAVASPVALIWMLAAYMQRASDVETVTDPLRQQLNLIFGEQSVAEARVQRFNAALQSQIELLRQCGTTGAEDVARLLQQIEQEKIALHDIAQAGYAHVGEAAKLTRAGEHFDLLLAGKLRQLQEIGERLQDGNNLLAGNAEEARTTLSALRQDIENGNRSLLHSLATGKSDGAALRDMLRSQEVDLHNAAAEIKALLARGGHDLNAALDRFNDQAADAEQAIARAGGALDSRTDALRQLGTEAPENLNKAAAQIQAGLERYNAIEHATRQAGEKTAALLSGHAAEIERTLGAFGARIETSGAYVTEQRDRLAALLDRFTGTATDLHASLHGSAINITQTAESGIAQYRAAIQGVEQDAKALAVTMNEGTRQIETAAARASAQAAACQSQTDSARSQVERHIATLETAANLITQTAAVTDTTLAKHTLQLMELEERQDRVATATAQNVAGADNATARLEQAGRIIAAESATLDSIAARNNTQIEKLATQMGALGDQTVATGAALAQQRADLVDQAAQNAATLEQLGAALRKEIAGALREAESAHGRFELLSNAGAAQIRSRVDQLAAMTQAAAVSAQDMEKMQTATAVQTGELVTLFARLADAHRDSAAAADVTALRLRETALDAMQAMEGFDARTQTALAGVREAGAGIETQTQALVAEGRTTREQALAMAAAAGTLLEKAQGLRAGMETEGDLLNATLARIAGEVDAAQTRLVTGARSLGDITTENAVLVQDQLDAALAQLDAGNSRIRGQLTDHAEDLRLLAQAEASRVGDGIAQLMNSFGATGQQLKTETYELLGTIGHGADLVQEQIGAALARMESGNSVFRDRLSSHANALQAQTDAETDRLHDRMAGLIDRMDEGGARLMQKTREMLDFVGQGSDAVESQIAAALTQIETGNIAIRDQVAGYAQELQERTRAEAERLEGNMVHLFSRMDGSANRLRGEIASMMEQVQGGGLAAEQNFAAVLAQIQQSHEAVAAESRAALSRHAENLGEHYAAEAARFDEGINFAVGQISAAGKHLQDQAAQVLIALDDNVARFGDTTASAADVLVGQIGRMEETGLRMSARLQNLGLQLQDGQTALDAAGGQVQRQAMQLAQQTAAAAQQMKSMLDVMRGGEERAQSLGSQVASQLQGVIIHLREEMQRMAEHGATAAQAAHDVATQVGTHARGMLDAAAEIREHGETLPAVLAEAGQHIAAAGSVLQTQASDATRLLTGSATLFRDAADANREGLLAHRQALQDAAATADAAMQQLEQRLAEQTDAAHTLVMAQDQLGGQTATTTAQIIDATDRLAHIRAGADAAHEQLMGKILYLDGQAQTTGKTLADGSDVLTQNIQRLATFGQLAEERLLEAGGDYQQRLAAMHQTLETQLAAVDQGIADTALRLETRAAGLRESALRGLTDIEPLLERFQATAGGGHAALADRTQELRVLLEEAAQLLLGFGTTFDTQIKHMMHAAEAVGQSQDYLTGMLNDGVKQVDTLHGKLENSRRVARASVDDIGAQLQRLGDNLQHHIGELSTETRQAVGLVQDTGVAWQDQADNLARTAQQVRGELAAISVAMDALRQKAVMLRDPLQGQSQDVIDSLTSMLNLDDAEEGAPDPLVDRIERGLQKIS